MKKGIKKFLVVLLAAVCALSFHTSVYAEGIADWIPDWMQDILNQWSTTVPNPDNTTAPPDVPTTDNRQENPTVTNPVSTEGHGSLTTTQNDPGNNNGNPNYNNQYPNGNGQQLIVTTSPATTAPEEDSSTSFSASLSGLFEQDTYDMIVNTPTEAFTIGAMIQPGNDDNGFTWQSAALIAALILFVVLLALVAALLIQRSKKLKKDAEDEKHHIESSEKHEPVSVEVMTPERIAELLGAAGKSRVGSFDASSDDSAAAIRAAALMGQITNAYSDPLIRKYTDEPVMISPVAKINLETDNVTGAQILDATNSLLDDFDTEASDSSVDRVSNDDLLGMSETLDASDSGVRACPECGKPVLSGDVFCHNCGAYVG